MKKIYKKLGAVGAFLIPTTTILSCGEVDSLDRGDLNEVVNSDEIIVDQIIQDLSNRPLKLNATGESTLASRITTPEQLEAVVKERYFYTDDKLTQVIPVIKSFNNIRGELMVDVFVHRGLVTKNISLTFRNFLSINKKLYQDNVANAITNIENAPGEINDYGKSIFPEATKSLTELKKGINNLPSGTLKYNPTIVPKVIETNNEVGSVVVQFTVAQEGVTDTVTMTYYGFLTVDQNDNDMVNNEINKINKLSTKALPNGAEIFPSEIKTQADLKKYVSVPIITNGVEMTINNYIPSDSTGELTVTYNLSKGKAKDFTTLTYSGFHITPLILSNKVKGFPNTYGGWTQKINEEHYLIGTFTQGVYQVEVNPETGDVLKTAPVSMSKTDPISIPSVAFGWSEQISDKFYLIGTEKDGVYQVEVNPETGYVTNSVQVSMAGERSIPDVNSGFAIKIAETQNYYHYLIGTAGGAIFQAAVNPKTGIIDSTVSFLGGSFMPPVIDGWAEKINDSHYLIGTKGEGIYEVSIDNFWNTNTVRLHTQRYEGILSDFSASQGWIQHIGGSHYLVGTNQNGVYQVEVDQQTGLIKPKSEKQVRLGGENSIPKVNTGWIQKIDSAHYLVGTHDQGIYRVQVNPENGQVVTASQIPKSIDFNIGDVAGGFSQEISKGKNFLIGTLTDGLYQLKIDLAWLKD